MDFSAIIPLPVSQGNNMFSSIKIDTEHTVEAPRKVELLDIFVTQFPRHCSEDLKVADYTFTYFEGAKTDFMMNQDYIQSLAGDLFGDTKALEMFEQNILNHSFVKSIKTAPTRSNRL
ncbi:hypothetical protein SAMN05421827_1416 [Pedobacter terrae]|uniref:Uncharacterized protein n=1 Tax=Pedobacter terrae TaxID=405671 RepID=A0A1G8ELD7_9SPHI|nr:hypothetical protein [Pedobacter terrae]SDH70753.1 hypothetical protein SAMN05421827_1416 [Pedobacter terrae]